MKINKNINHRMDCIEEKVKARKECAERKVRMILEKFPREVQELALDGLAARRRGDQPTIEQEQALTCIENMNIMEALKELEPYKTAEEKKRALELSNRLEAGEDWREIRLEAK